MKQYKAQAHMHLSPLMEWVNEWTFSGWILHTFTHQENDDGVWYVAVLEKTMEVETDES